MVQYLYALQTCLLKIHRLSGKTLVMPQLGPIAPFIQKTAPAVKLVVTTDYEDSLGGLFAVRQMQRHWVITLACTYLNGFIRVK